MEPSDNTVTADDVNGEVTDERLLSNNNELNSNTDSNKYTSSITKKDIENNDVKLKVEPNVRHWRRLTSRANTLYLLLRMSTEYNMLVKQWLLCVLLCSVSGYREQKFAMEPQDQVR